MATAASTSPSPMRAKRGDSGRSRNDRRPPFPTFVQRGGERLRFAAWDGASGLTWATTDARTSSVGQNIIRKKQIKSCNFPNYMLHIKHDPESPSNLPRDRSPLRPWLRNGSWRRLRRRERQRRTRLLASRCKGASGLAIQSPAQRLWIAALRSRWRHRRRQGHGPPRRFAPRMGRRLALAGAKFPEKNT